VTLGGKSPEPLSFAAEATLGMIIVPTTGVFPGKVFCTKRTEEVPAAPSVSSGDLLPDVRLTSADVRADVTTKSPTDVSNEISDTSPTGKEPGDNEIRDYVVLQKNLTLLVNLLTQGVQMVMLTLMVLSRKFSGIKYDTIDKLP
jgi:hypothetical protein